MQWAVLRRAVSNGFFKTPLQVGFCATNAVSAHGFNGIQVRWPAFGPSDWIKVRHPVAPPFSPRCRQ